MKEQRYAVIGGQYQAFCHGTTATIESAKRLAANSEEFWDNFGGWRRPAIYRIEDTEMVNNFYGETRAPKDGAWPVMTWNSHNRKWENVG
jgi:hypothetical protein